MPRSGMGSTNRATDFSGRLARGAPAAFEQHWLYGTAERTFRVGHSSREGVLDSTLVEREHRRISMLVMGCERCATLRRSQLEALGGRRGPNLAVAPPLRSRRAAFSFRASRTFSRTTSRGQGLTRVAHEPLRGGSSESFIGLRRSFDSRLPTCVRCGQFRILA